MNKYLVIIPFHHPWKWHTDYANQAALLLSRRFPVVCFLWGDAVSIKEILLDKKQFQFISHPTKNLYLFQPIHVIPLRRLGIVRLINLLINVLLFRYILWRLRRTDGPDKRILWIFGFFEEPFFVLFPLFFSHALLYYDCLDIAWQPTAWASKLVQFAEKQLVRHARWMSVNSHTLFEKWRHIRPTVFLVPSGAPPLPKDPPIKIAHPNPVIGYIGAIGYRIDFTLLTHLIKRNPQWHFLLAGPVFMEREGNMQGAMEAIRKLPNVTITEVDKSHIPSLLAKCDVGIIPYDSFLPFNRYSFPLKLMEYFAAGLPVVSTNINELKRFPGLVTCGETVESWERAIRDFLKTPLTPRQVARARSIVQANSWENKLNRIMSVIEKDLS